MRWAVVSGFAKTAMLVGAVSVAAFVPDRAKSENLADALISAYNTSGLLDQYRALTRAADEDVAIAVSALRPVIDWSIRAGRDLQRIRNTGGTLTVDSRTSNFFTGLSFEQLLYDGGAAFLGKQSAQEFVLATRQTLLDIEQEVLFDAVVAYVNVLLQEENVSLRQNNVRVLGEELRAAQDRFDVGEVTKTDVALAESRLANARANLSVAEGDLRDARAQYTNAVGRAPGQLAGAPRMPKFPASLAEATNIAMRNHPRILRFQHEVRAAELGVQQARKALGPSATIRADVGLTDAIGTPQYNHNGSVALQFRQPIYQGGRLAAQVRRAMAQRDSLKGVLITTQRDITQLVNAAYVRVQAARATLVATNERVRAAQVAFDGIREEATLGARTTLDVLTAEQDLLDAQTARVQARAEEIAAAYQLVQAQGLLTAERLGLAVQIYDPTIYYNLVKGAPANVSQRSKDLDRVLESLGKK
ncbi:TolC family outer membrane protein [Primorskyibacter sp. S87]|uniref:TolC family outer membrane protein n=1 Tax=Primorskyibacter sp. S87 TaxID=3415126 RepID=UPI003C7C9521